MKVQKAYILKIDSDISNEYAKTAAESCEKINLPWKYFEGVKDKSNEELKKWLNLPENLTIKKMNQGAACATAGHIKIWQKIHENRECAIVLEHDAIMLHSLDIDIPDNLILNLGYKIFDVDKYDHKKAGKTRQIKNVKKFAGAHAYAITHETAKILLDEVKERGVWDAIDNMCFMRHRQDHTKVPCAVADPICALGWLRKSTIWRKPALHNEKPLIDSFKNNFKGKA